MKMTITELKNLDNNALFDLIRTVISYRLIGLPVSYIASACEITEQAVKRILLDNGDVPLRGRRHHWTGTFSVSEKTYKSLALPAYIPIHVDGVTLRMTNQTAWMAITRDAVVIRMADGARQLYGGHEPFHRDQGAEYTTPEIGAAHHDTRGEAEPSD